MNYTRVMTIAGSDSGGGAGIQADIKTISALGGFATSAITAITAQNTVGVTAVHPIPLEILDAQINAILADIGTDAVKIGMTHSREVIEIIVNTLNKYNITNIVVDPVMVATSGDKLIQEEAIAALQELLLPKARIITPNIPEAEILLRKKITSQSQLPEMARELSLNKNVSVFLKAGHLSDDTLTDILYDAESDIIVELTSKRVYSQNTHGTGCTLSSALATELAKGKSITEAAKAAKDYINSAIVSGVNYEIGKGHGPVNHFWKQN